MFGYVKPVKEALTEDRFLDFRSVYCGLCRTIGERYGFYVSNILNYDFTFLALLLDCGSPHETGAIRCPLHPMGKRTIRRTTEGLAAAADVSVILTWHKLADGAADETGAKRLAALAAKGALGSACRRAEGRMPAYGDCVRRGLAELSDLEAAKERSLDRMADIFARLLSGIPQGESPRARILSEILYHTGRWIYIVDAFDDFEKDITAGRYNPIAARYGCENGGMNDRIRESVAFTLENSLAAMSAAFELLDVRCDEELLRNIIYLGMPQVMGQVLRGDGGQKERNNGRSV